MDERERFVRLKYKEQLQDVLDRIILKRLDKIRNMEGEYNWHRIFTLTKSTELLYKYDTHDDHYNIYSLQNLYSSDLEECLNNIIKQLEKKYKNYMFKVLKQQYNIQSYDVFAIVKVEEYKSDISKFKTSMDIYPTTVKNPAKGKRSMNKIWCCVII